jgi:hypothetical protein
MTAPKRRAATHPSDLAASELAEVELAGSDLAGVELADSDLADFELAGSDLAGVELAGSDLADFELAGSDLAGADLAGFDLAGADLAGCDLARSELVGSDLAEVELAGSDLDMLGMTAPGAAPEVSYLAANAQCGASAILAPGGPTAVPFDLCCVLTLVRAVGTDPGPAVCRALEMLDVDQPLAAESAS